MTLDDDAVKLGQAIGDIGIVSLGDRLGVKETTGVVQLDLAQLGQAAEFTFRLAKRMIDLRDDRPGGHGFVQRVLPEIAHQAVPWAFLVGEKNRQAIDEVAVGRALFL